MKSIPQDPLFIPLPSPEEMSRWDNLTERDYGLPTLLLMENAAREAFHTLKEQHGIWPGLRVLVLAGGGNNGGDGVALARLFYNAGCAVRLVTMKRGEEFSGIALEHYQAALKAGVEAICMDELHALPGKADEDYPEVIVDAVLGAGFKGPIRGKALKLVTYINRMERSYIFSLDIPSGLNALTGRPEPLAVRARLTATFGAAKCGLCLPWARPYTGTLSIRAIGIPRELMQDHPPARRLTQPREGILPMTSPYAHKGQKGCVLVIGGSAGFVGAPFLSALAAARTGVGLITVAAPESVCAEARHRSPEIMTLPLPGNSWEEVVNGAGLRTLQNFITGLPHNSAIVLGPGLGRDDGAVALAQIIAAMPGRPQLVLDADGLFTFRALPPEALEGSGLISLAALREDDIVTPHPGEMFRLLSGSEPENAAVYPAVNRLFSTSDLVVQEGREAGLKAALAHTYAAVLLKGPGSLVGKAGAPISIVSFATEALGVGGSGDVLSGVIAALLARQPIADFSSDRVAALGAWLHGRAGEICARSFPAGGNLASDIAGAIPAALLELVKL